MKIRVVYRSVGWENNKPRPPWYTKHLCLLSFVQAVEDSEVPVEIVYLNDGEIPAEILALMRATGEVVRLETPPGKVREMLRHGRGGSGVVRSHMEAMSLPERRGWPEDDLVYFVEDDYLHRPEALTRLRRAADQVPGASYFGLYASVVRRRAQGFQVDDDVWFEADSTTLTYAARIGVLHRDRWLHRFGLTAGGFIDLNVCKAYMGIRPYKWPRVAGSAFGLGPMPPRAPRARAKAAAMQTAVNVMAVQRSFDPRLLIAPGVGLATHSQVHQLAPEFDWDELARQVQERAERDGRARSAA